MPPLIEHVDGDTLHGARAECERDPKTGSARHVERCAGAKGMAVVLVRESQAASAQGLFAFGELDRDAVSARDRVIARVEIELQVDCRPALWW